uniref:T-brain n=1 Tax=Isodiametra pulchra TaxID=504439 RepID=K9MZ04_ISOPU|nr:T-brain [Isodiametra pulchra]
MLEKGELLAPYHDELEHYSENSEVFPAQPFKSSLKEPTKHQSDSWSFNYPNFEDVPSLKEKRGLKRSFEATDSLRDCTNYEDVNNNYVAGEKPVPPQHGRREANDVSALRSQLIPLLSTKPDNSDCGASHWESSKCSLVNMGLWGKFSDITTEMIVTKVGRRMFPSLAYTIEGLEPESEYHCFVFLKPTDCHQWKFHAGRWKPAGQSQPNVASSLLYEHPHSPAAGKFWCKSPDVSFAKLKLTNNKNCTNPQMVVLNSMSFYQPQLVLVRDFGKRPASELQWKIFTFPVTRFVAVTAYQNTDITQLKIDNNPFAKGFRDVSNGGHANSHNRVSHSSPTSMQMNPMSQPMNGMTHMPFPHPMQQQPRHQFPPHMRHPLPAGFMYPPHALMMPPRPGFGFYPGTQPPRMSTPRPESHLQYPKMEPSWSIPQGFNPELSLRMLAPNTMPPFMNPALQYPLFAPLQQQRCMQPSPSPVPAQPESPAAAQSEPSSPAVYDNTGYGCRSDRHCQSVPSNSASVRSQSADQIQNQPSISSDHERSICDVETSQFNDSLSSSYSRSPVVVDNPMSNASSESQAFDQSAGLMKPHEPYPNFADQNYNSHGQTSDSPLNELHKSSDGSYRPVNMYEAPATSDQATSPYDCSSMGDTSGTRTGGHARNSESFLEERQPAAPRFNMAAYLNGEADFNMNITPLSQFNGVTNFDSQEEFTQSNKKIKISNEQPNVNSVMNTAFIPPEMRFPAFWQ